MAHAMNMSDTLDESYGNTPMEQLSNITFESKENVDCHECAIINELLLKVNNACSFNTNKVCHSLNFVISSEIFNASDQIKEELDCLDENYNSDFEDEHEWEDEDDGYSITTEVHCKIEPWLPLFTENIQPSLSELELLSELSEPDSCRRFRFLLCSFLLASCRS